MTPQQFVAKWSRSTLTERSACQQHFLDLCELLGQPKPAEVDPDGNFSTFEKGLEKTGGGHGRRRVSRLGTLTGSRYTRTDCAFARSVSRSERNRTSLAKREEQVVFAALQKFAESVTATVLSRHSTQPLTKITRDCIIPKHRGGFRPFCDTSE